MAEHKDEIEIFHLPPYSPERNPDEYLHYDLQAGISQKVAPRHIEELKKNVNSHMKLLQKNHDPVVNYFHHDSIKYAA